MAVTPSGAFSLTLSYLRAAIADCWTWRALVEQPDATWEDLATLIAAQTSLAAPALARILYGAAEDEEGHDDYVARPRCLISVNAWSRRRRATTVFALEASLFVRFEVPIPTAYRGSNSDAELDALNKLGGIVGELERLGQQAGYPDIVASELHDFGQADSKHKQGARFFVSELFVDVMGEA